MLTNMTAFGDSEKSVTEISKKATPVFGIDLGTTNSAISVISSGSASEAIQLTNGKFTMPSCVMWKNGEVIVGKEAYEHRHEACTVYSVKSLMQDVNATVTIEDGDNVFTKTPAEVSSLILRGLVEQTGGLYGEIKDVVVTVPAYFDQNGVNATREACQLAGLNLIGIANEPTAASLCYQLKPADGTTKDVIVYDLGGGTFDVTLMRISDSDNDAISELAALYAIDSKDTASHSVTTLGISGDTKLGGDNVDRAMLRILYDKLRAVGVNTSKFEKKYRERLILRLEELKKKDVMATIYDFGVDTIDVDGNHVSATVQLFPEDFKEAMYSIYSKTREIMNKLLNEVPNNAETIVLVGGSTKNAWLQEFLRRDYPSMVLDNALNPDLSVSNGAAIQGKVMAFGDSEVQIFDILPLTIGILNEDRVTPLIKKGSALPSVVKKTFTTVFDNQTVMDVELFQGNSSFKKECISLGKLVIDGIAPKPAGEPSLSLTISVSADRLMKCKASVDGIEKELELNLAGEVSQDAQKLSRHEKNILRWKSTINKFTDEAERIRLLQLVDDYEKCVSETVKAEIVDGIREQREKLLAGKVLNDEL